MLSTSSRVAAVALAVLPVIAGAQEERVKTWGPVLGLTRTTIGGSAGKSAGYESRSGFVAGVQSQRELKNGARFFRSGIAFVRRGGGQADTSGNELRLNLTYIEVPALIGVNLVRREAFKAHVLGGLQAGVKTGCSFDFTTGGTKLHLGCDDPTIAFKTKAFDFAAVAGGGLAFARPNGTFTMSGTYAWGFGTIDDGSPAGELLNRGASFSVGYLVPMRRR